MAAFDPTHSRVIWYSGGTAAGKWRECLHVPTLAEAEAQIAEIERGGRPAMLWHEQALPEGAPHWWDFGTLSPRVGAIRISERGAYHEGKYTIEAFEYANQSRPWWAQPAWDERGLPELLQHFDTRDAAVRALALYGLEG